MNVTKHGTCYRAPTEIVCKTCKAEMTVGQNEWRKGDYGSEWIIKCPECKSEIVMPGTEYTGDF